VRSPSSLLKLAFVHRLRGRREGLASAAEESLKILDAVTNEPRPNANGVKLAASNETVDCPSADLEALCYLLRCE
jgi:hypothetical protein